MPATQASAIALHVEAAKRLLQELALHADSAMSVLGQESGNDFFAAVDERGRILEELDAVVDALAHARAQAGPGARQQVEPTLLNDMARAATAALESQEQLMLRTRQERDRLAQALKATKRTDSIASQYTAASMAGRPRTLSVTG